MDQRYIEHLLHYSQRRKVYDKYFDQLIVFLLAHPNSTYGELEKWTMEIFGRTMNTGDLRMVSDARKIINIFYNNVPVENASVEMHTLEDGDSSVLTWKEIPDKRLLVLSDIHFPYHCKSSLMLALRHGKEKDVDSILLNGDILDFYQLSKFSKDHRKPSIEAELDIFRFFIDQLKQRFPDANIYYKEGNHEIRLTRWIQENAQRFGGLMDLDRLVNFKDHGITYLKDNIGVKLGKLSIIHGHEIRASMGVVNIARTYYMKAQSNILFGHWHQNQEYITKNIEGQISGAWTQGCLCKLDSDYTYGINQWVNGFSIVDRLDDQGNFRVQLKKIINGEIL